MRRRRRLGPKASRALMVTVSVRKNPSSRRRRIFAGNGVTESRHVPFFYTPITKSKFPFRRGLLRADASRRDVGLVVVLPFDRRVGKPPQHRELPDVRQRVGDRPLKQFLRRVV